ncbi:MAG: DNA double-strand break repair nuclease NurA [SAR202 cluster bacterium]|nr:DNA double-strand break repair nuclease NurA [Dehalococcoidia bacterium]MQF87803.1 DNA double-strand break repair nuclease NurA [SAR202 cluster bacterium]
MGLDMGQTVLQLDRLTQSVRGASQAREDRLTALINAAASIDPETAAEKTSDTRQRPYLAAEVDESLLGAYPPLEPPADWVVAAVDGSHIDVDRHLPVACYLLNFGGCVLTYGSQPDATLFSQPHLATTPEELYISDPANSMSEEMISGPLLGLVRTVKELETLANTVEQCPPGLPVLGLVDGSLVLWGLSGQAYRPYVTDAIINDGLLPAMKRLEKLSETRPVALAAYVSYPRSTEAVNAVRCSLCPHDNTVCTKSCNNRRSAQQPCNSANEFLDRNLFQRLLEPGWRSPVYKTNSSVSRDSYDEANKVYFFYVNAGEEIGRVEVPKWVAKNETLLSLTHGLVWDQCQRGQGYPVAISESHEQAVVSAGDRRVFRRMLTDSLERQGLSAATSQKDRSKRSPWV